MSLTFLIFCKKAKVWLQKKWSWCKKHWELFLGILIPLVLMIIFRKKTDMSSVYLKINDDHEREVEAIESAHTEEVKKVRLASKKYTDAVRNIEKKYNNNIESLDTEEQERVLEILHESGEDPEVLSAMLAERFGN